MDKKDIILNLILKEGPISREKIVYKVGIGKVTLGKIIRKLIKEGKIIENGKISQGRGRGAKLLKVNPNLLYVLSVSYRSGKFTGGIVNLDRNLLFRYETFSPEKNGDSFFTTLISFIEEIEETSKIDKEKILGIGISLPGIFDIKKGKILGLQGEKKWKEILLKDILEEKFKKKVSLIDDTDALARMEYERRKAEKVKNLLYIYLGEGIGLGMVLNGKLYVGSRGNVGEIGHLIVDNDGSRCYCGNYGCLETFAGINSIIYQIKKGIREGVHSIIEDLVNGELNKINIEKIALAIEEGDKLTISVVEKAGEYIGKVTAFLINIFNPEIVVFGGPLTLTGEILLSEIEKEVRRKSLTILLKNLSIKFSQFSPQDQILGTALSILDSL